MTKGIEAMVMTICNFIRVGVCWEILLSPFLVLVVVFPFLGYLISMGSWAKILFSKRINKMIEIRKSFMYMFA